MTTQNVSGWLPNLLGPVELRDDGVVVTPRGAINFLNCTVTDNPEADSVDVDPGGGGGGGGPLGGSVSGPPGAVVVERIDGVLGNVNIAPAQQTWGSPTSGVVGKILSAPLATSGATPTALVAYAVPENSVVDFVVTVVGRWSSGSGAAGHAYRADLVCTYQRIGNAAPTLVGAAAAPTNVRSVGSGSAWAASVGVSANMVVAYGAGAAGANVRWTAVVQGQQVA